VTVAPLVSVVLPVWNRERYVEAAARSVLGQTRADRRRRRLDRRQPGDPRAPGRLRPRLRVVAAPHEGQSAAINRGLALVRGRRVAFQDSDDLWRPAALERLEAAGSASSPAPSSAWPGSPAARACSGPPTAPPCARRVACPGHTRLRQVAARLAPERVTFHDPVSPERILPEISGYDLGVSWVRPPTSYNLQIAMPNKIFEWAMAGLPMVCGPNQGADRLVAEEGIGVVPRRFDPRNFAAALDALSPRVVGPHARALRRRRPPLQTPRSSWAASSRSTSGCSASDRPRGTGATATATPSPSTGRPLDRRSRYDPAVRTRAGA